MNALYYGDNLDVLRERAADESVDLVYLDSPFNSSRSYNVLFKSTTADEEQAQIEALALRHAVAHALAGHVHPAPARRLHGSGPRQHQRHRRHHRAPRRKPPRPSSATNRPTASARSSISRTQACRQSDQGLLTHLADLDRAGGIVSAAAAPVLTGTRPPA